MKAKFLRCAAPAVLAAGLLVTMPLAMAHAQSAIRIGIQEDPDSFDPARAFSFVGRIILHSLCNKLIDVDTNLNFVPELALSWETAPDGKAVTFKLRPNAKFSDGTDIDAAAVAFNLDRAMNLPTSRRKSEVSAIQSVDAVDKLTVRVNLKHPFAPLLAQLSDRAGTIASPKALANPDGFDKAPACSGPFKFAERVQQDKVVLVRDPNYWNAGKFHLDRVEFRIIPDAAIRVANLRAGSLDFAERLLASDIAGLKAEGKYKVMVGPGLRYVGITMNINNGAGATNDFAKKAQLREAFDLSIDRAALSQVIFDGNALPGNQAQPSTSPYYAKERPVKPRDVAKARELIKASGVANPALEMMYVNTPEQSQLAQMLQAMAKDAGIELKLRMLEFQTLLSAQAKGDYQASLIGWSGRIDPDGNVYTLLGCKSPTNDGKYCNEKAEGALLRGQAETDLQKRYKNYQEALAQIADDRPIIYLYHPPNIMAATAKLDGFVFHPDGLIRLQNVKYAR